LKVAAASAPVVCRGQTTRLDCAACACYNRIDSSARREFREFAASTPVANGLRGNSMKNPLDSLWGTIISGLILTVVLYFVVKSMLA
jgi:hypothetical protein